MERLQFREEPTTFQWGVYFLGWLTPGLRQYLSRLTQEPGDKLFLEGLSIEYGLDAEVNLQKAYKKYSMAAAMDHSLAMYKLAEQEMMQWKHGRKPDRDEEMYLRFRAFAFLDTNQEPQGLEISREVSKYMRQYDPERVKLGELVSRIQGRKDPVDLAYIKAKLGLFSLSYEQLSGAIGLLTVLVSQYHHLDAAFTLAMLYSQQSGILQQDELKAREYYRICEASKYYKSYTSMGKFLLRAGHKQEALKVFQQASTSGYYGGLPYLLSNKFQELDAAKQICKLIDGYVTAILTGNVMCILNFMHIRCLSKMDPEYYNPGHDFIESELIHSVKELYELQRLKEIKSKDDFVMAYVLIVSLGLVVTQLDQQDILINEAFHQTQSGWLKRYCVTNLMEVRRQKCLQNPTPERVQVLSKTGITLADKYLVELNNTQTASYFYYLAQIYRNGWGVEPSRLLYYLYLCKAAEWVDTDTTGLLFLQYYKAKQAKEELSAITQLPQIVSLSKKIREDLGDNRTCDICYERTKQVFFNDCGHYCCAICYKLIIKPKDTCHMCRKPVRVVNLIKCVLKFE